MQKQRNQAEFLALIALFSGGLCTGSAGLLVRLSETGPVATAFWRGLLDSETVFFRDWESSESELQKPPAANNSSGLAVASGHDS